MSAAIIVERASKGDIGAQTEMAEVAIGMASAGLGDRLICLIEATVFARLAAAQGGDGDRGRLVSTLSLLGEELQAQGKNRQADIIHGEAIAHLDLLADQGEPIADNNMQLLADNSTVTQLQLASLFRKSWKEVLQ